MRVIGLVVALALVVPVSATMQASGEGRFEMDVGSFGTYAEDAALEDGRLVVGSTEEVAQIFEQGPDGWHLAHTVNDPTGPYPQYQGAGFAQALDADGDLLAIGAPRHGWWPYTGAIHLYSLAGGEPAYIGNATFEEGLFADGLGESVAVGGDIAVAGSDASWTEDRVTSGRALAAFVYGDRVKAAEIHAPVVTEGEHFGHHVGTDGQYIAVGAPGYVSITSGRSNDNGTIYIYEVGPGRSARVAYVAAVHGQAGQGLGLDFEVVDGSLVYMAGTTLVMLDLETYDVSALDRSAATAPDVEIPGVHEEFCVGPISIANVSIETTSCTRVGVGPGADSSARNEPLRAAYTPGRVLFQTADGLSLWTQGDDGWTGEGVVVTDVEHLDTSDLRMDGDVVVMHGRGDDAIEVLRLSELL